MISLLSPAKNMDFSNSSGNSTFNYPLYMEESTVLMNKLKKLSSKQLSNLMNLNPQLSDLNFDRNQRWNSKFEENEQKVAIFAFNGEVYRGLKASEFSSADLSFATEHLVILSGLHGVLRPLDIIQPYRLEMGSKIKIKAGVKNLYEFWGKKVTDYLNNAIATHKEKAVVNLASNEYFKVVRTGDLNARIIDFTFLDWKNGSYKSVMTWAKLARGMMANAIIKGKIDNLEEIKSVTFSNYAFNDALSTDVSYVFTREKQPA